MENYLIHYTIEEFRSDLKKIVIEAIKEVQAEKKEPTGPEYVTRKQVKDKLHVSYPTLHRYDKEGLLTAQKIGGRVLYLWSDVENAIKQDYDRDLKYARIR